MSTMRFDHLCIFGCPQKSEVHTRFPAVFNPISAYIRHRKVHSTYTCIATEADMSETEYSSGDGDAVQIWTEADKGSGFSDIGLRMHPEIGVGSTVGIKGNFKKPYKYLNGMTGKVSRRTADGRWLVTLTPANKKVPKVFLEDRNVELKYKKQTIQPQIADRYRYDK